MKNKIKEYFETHREELIEDIKAFVRIESIKNAAVEGMPFGVKNAEMCLFAEKRLKELGFQTSNYNNYVMTAWNENKPLKLDILGHLDVVSANPGEWTITPPFTPVVKDGKLYGRGAADDKGPVIAAIYAVKAVKDMKLPLNYSVRLILGFDEESGSADVEYFYKHEKAAPYTFTPDADFPVINCEKGGYWSAFCGDFAQETADARVLLFHGGESGNAIPGAAEALLLGCRLSDIQDAADKVSGVTGVIFQCTKENEKIRIKATGKTTHASTPEKGKNAITSLLEVIKRTLNKTEQGTKALMELSVLFPMDETEGMSAGIAMHTDNGCKMTANLTILDYDGKHLSGRIDCRTPMCATYENTVMILKRRFGECNLSLQNEELCPAHYVSEDSEFVQKLLKCFRMYTGKEGECLTSGGMTYAHHIDNAVAFGCTFDGRDNHIHGADEYIDIDELIISAEIFTQAIVEICS